MHPAPSLQLALAFDREREARAQARRAAVARYAELARQRTAIDGVTVRRAAAGDAAALSALAELDGASPEAERLAAAARGGEDPVLVAETGGAIIAALDLSRDLLVADPFRRASEATELLRLRAGQLRRSAGRERAGFLGRLRPRTG